MLSAKLISQIGKKPVVVEDLTTIIIEDGFGNPIAVVMEVAPNICSITTADESDFNRVLEALGINKVVVDTPIKNTNAPPTGAKLLQGPFQL